MLCRVNRITVCLIYCSFLREAIHCRVSLVSSGCGSLAGKFALDLLKVIHRRLAKKLRCRIPNEHNFKSKRNVYTNYSLWKDKVPRRDYIDTVNARTCHYTCIKPSYSHEIVLMVRYIFSGSPWGKFKIKSNFSVNYVRVFKVSSVYL